MVKWIYYRPLQWGLGKLSMPIVMGCCFQCVPLRVVTGIATILHWFYTTLKWYRKLGMGPTGWWKRTEHSQVPPILTHSAARIRALGVFRDICSWWHRFHVTLIYAASTQKLVNITKACFYVFHVSLFCVRLLHSVSVRVSVTKQGMLTWLNPFESRGQQHKNATKVKASRWETQAALDPKLGTKMHSPDGLPYVYHYLLARTKRLK